MPRHTRSERERKAMFAKMNNPSDKRVSNQPPKQLMRSRTQPLPPDVRMFLSDKISKNIREGKPRDQAVAIAFSQTRKKFPSQASRLTLPRSSSHIDQRRLRSLLFTLLGAAIAIRILREIRN